MRVFVLLATIAMMPLAATAEPVLKIINFTADWCPNCHILNPRMAEAKTAFADELIEMVDLDMTHARGPDKLDVFADAIRLAQSHQAGYLWDWYGGATGIAVIIAADNGEPISCLNRALSVDQMIARMNEAMILSTRAPAGSRRPQGPDCPPPMK